MKISELWDTFRYELDDLREQCVEEGTIQKEIYSIRWRTSCTKGTWKPRKNAKTTATIIRTQKDGNQSPALLSLFRRSTMAVYSFG